MLLIPRQANANVPPRLLQNENELRTLTIASFEPTALRYLHLCGDEKRPLPLLLQAQCKERALQSGNVMRMMTNMHNSV